MGLTTRPMLAGMGRGLATKTAPPGRGLLGFETGRLPTLPHTCACSTIGAERLNFRVRDGNGWVPLAMVTQNRRRRLRLRLTRLKLNIDGRRSGKYLCIYNKFYGQAERAISNGKLNVLLRFHIRPI